MTGNQTGENPFANYRPPAVTEILDPDFRQVFIDRKLNGVAAGVKAALLTGNTAEEFVRGESSIGAQYECASLAFLFGLDLEGDEPEAAQDMVGRLIFNHIVKGVESALREKRLATRFTSRFGYDFDEYEPSVLKVVLSAAPVE